MACKCAKPTDEHHGWECDVTGGECAFIIPDSKLCAKIYGEGPDAVEQPSGKWEGMERLTMRVDNGLEEIYFYNPDDPEGEYTLSDIAKNGHDDICDQIANRLAAYEDTGLTPEEVHRLKAKYEALESDKNVIESSHIKAEMNLEAQQQEIELLKIARDNWKKTAKIWGKVLKQAREALDDSLQYIDEACIHEAIAEINKVIGGKEDA